MKISARQTDCVLTLEFEREKYDRAAIRNRKSGEFDVKFPGGKCRFVMPVGWRLSDTHPDLVAAAALSICGSFSTRKTEFPFPVSNDFVQRISQFFKGEFGPVDSSLTPRVAPPDSRPGLSFSGGVDSCAARLLLPSNTAAIFVERINPPNQVDETQYVSDAAVRAGAVLAEAGHEVMFVQTDVEWLREPLGFVNDSNYAIPFILMADFLRFDALAFGLILESAYLQAGKKFREYGESDHWIRFSGLTAAVDLPWLLPTAGLSEVVTSRLVLESPYQHIAQSCVRGSHGHACMRCQKCFRKVLLDAALTRIGLPIDELNSLLESRYIRGWLQKRPMKHENVFIFITDDFPQQHPALQDLKARLHADRPAVDWMEKWYTPARAHLAPRYRDAVETRILSLVEPMSDADIAAVRNWDRVSALQAI